MESHTIGFVVPSQEPKGRSRIARWDDDLGSIEDVSRMGSIASSFARVTSDGDVVGLMVFLGIMGAIGIVALVNQSTAHYDVVIKGGVPYCPKCNRQVTYRRDYCRCCGYNYVSYKKKN